MLQLNLCYHVRDRVYGLWTPNHDHKKFEITFFFFFLLTTLGHVCETTLAVKIFCVHIGLMLLAIFLFMTPTMGCGVAFNLVVSC